METSNHLANRWRELKASGRSSRIRDDAHTLGVSELELLFTMRNEGVIPLDVTPVDLIRAMPNLGRTMVLTRNEACVIERKGTFENISASADHILVVGPDIDLRLFPNVWKHTVAVTTATPRGVLRSFQVFDAAGDAVIKIYATEQSDLDAYEGLVSAWRVPADDFVEPKLIARTAPPPDRPNSAIDVQALTQSWAALQDTHDFYPMLRKHGVGRLQALRLVGKPWAQQIASNAIERLLATASADGIDIMCFVGNHGALEIHTGPVDRVVPLDAWINVMDADWNLHLNQALVASVWGVVKPSVDGLIHSIEVFDASNNMVVQFFGKRKPGLPEREDWRGLWNVLMEMSIEKH